MVEHLPHIFEALGLTHSNTHAYTSKGTGRNMGTCGTSLTIKKKKRLSKEKVQNEKKLGPEETE